MANFIGSECIVCKEKFKDNDDIVVCPECGTPYHRDCYLKEGSCINTELHEKNESWSEKQAETDGEQQKKCEACNTMNKPHAIICENCGASLVDNLNFGNTAQQGNNSRENINLGGFNFDLNDKYCGMDPAEVLDENVSVSEAADFVGSNAQYYLLHFKRMKETGKKITLNIICILFPQFYFANRKMWIETIITIILTAILSVPSMIYTIAVLDNSNGIVNSLNLQSNAFEMIVQLTNYASMGVHVLACIFGNWLYYRHTIRKVKSIKNQCGDNESIAKEKIQRSGGTSFLYIFIAFAIEMVITALITWIIINV